MIATFPCPTPVAVNDAGETAPCRHTNFRLIKDTTGHTFLRCQACFEDHALGDALIALTSLPTSSEGPT